MGDPAERQNGPQSDRSASIVRSRNCRQWAISAPPGLFCGGTQRTALVIGAPTQLKRVVAAAHRSVAAARPNLHERRIEQVAGIVAGEGTAGAVGALEAGRQPDDQQAHRAVTAVAHPAATGRVEPVGLGGAIVVAKRTAGADRADSRGPGSNWLFDCVTGSRAAAQYSLVVELVVLFGACRRAFLALDRIAPISAFRLTRSTK